MAIIILKCLDCDETEDTDFLERASDECRLDIFIDGQKDPVVKLRRDMDDGDRWVLNDMEFAFNTEVKIKLWDEDRGGEIGPIDPDPDDLLGEIKISSEVKHRAWGKFTEDEAKYTFWYEVMASDMHPIEFHRLPNTEHPTISLRQMLGRFGQGVLPTHFYDEIEAKSIYKFSEFISLQDTFRFHAMQDGGRGGANSVKTWVNRHCNLWGEVSVVPIKDTPEGLHQVFDIGLGGKSNWKTVTDEQSRVVAGFQHYSRRSTGDFEGAHETNDWLWDQIVDPAFTYMLDYTAKNKKITSVEESKISDLDREIQFIHNEWETGSFPIQWRPFWGEYVTTWGRHVFDVGHTPVYVEIHPAHTLVREHTTAAPLGNGGSWVPVNRAIIGMSFSGGFPGHVGSRWDDEFGGRPDEISGDAKKCWATNLKKHPLKFRLFPPVPRPNDMAVLKSRIVLCEYIQVPDWEKANNFLNLCQENEPAKGDLGFRDWNRSRERPKGFTPEIAPTALQPKFTLRHNAYFDVEVDLSSIAGIPLGYYAIIECGWSERTLDTKIYEFDVTFEKFKAVKTDDNLTAGDDDWHMYYGVNGQWAAWWTDDRIEEGKTYIPPTTSFRVWALNDDMPLSIRESGIESQGVLHSDGSHPLGLPGNKNLDRIEITASGPDHFDQIPAHAGVTLVSRDTNNSLKFTVRGWEQNHSEGGSGATKHEWTINIVRREL